MSLHWLLFLILPYFCQSSHAPQVFKLNLDLPPSDRWTEIITAKKSTLQQFNQEILNGAVLPSSLLNFINNFANKLYRRPEVLAEITGIAKAADLPFGEVFVLNFIYELFALCTSTVSQDENGNIIHGRNLDYRIVNNFKSFANLAIRVQFYKGGKYLFEADTMAGYIGVLTGVKPNAFGISLNQRDSANIFVFLYELVINRVYSVPYYMRLVLENEDNFESAVEKLKNEPFAAQCYLTVSGVKANEGVIIERNRRNVNNITYLDEDQWFLVQTNYDRGVPDPADDYRRIPAENKIRNIGRKNITAQRLFDEVLSQEPNFNYKTIWSSVMSPQTMEFNTTVWRD